MSYAPRVGTYHRRAGGLTAGLQHTLVMSCAPQKAEDGTFLPGEVLEVSCGCSFGNAGLQEATPLSWDASHLEELKIRPFSPQPALNSEHPDCSCLRC